MPHPLPVSPCLTPCLALRRAQPQCCSALQYSHEGNSDLTTRRLPIRWIHPSHPTRLVEDLCRYSPIIFPSKPFQKECFRTTLWGRASCENLSNRYDTIEEQWVLQNKGHWSLLWVRETSVLGLKLILEEHYFVAYRHTHPRRA